VASSDFLSLITDYCLLITEKSSNTEKNLCQKVEDIAQIANSSAQALGIAKYDIYGSSVDETDVDVFQGEPKQVQASNRSSVIVRVWNRDNQVGVTSTTDVGQVGLQLALKTAQEASFFGVKENVPDFSPTVPPHLPRSGQRNV
jgi:PmbA protein